MYEMRTQLQQHTEPTLDRVIHFLGHDPGLKRQPVEGAEVRPATATLTSSLSSLYMLPPSFPHMTAAYCPPHRPPSTHPPPSPHMTANCRMLSSTHTALSPPPPPPLHRRAGHSLHATTPRGSTPRPSGSCTRTTHMPMPSCTACSSHPGDRQGGSPGTGSRQLPGTSDCSR